MAPVTHLRPTSRRKRIGIAAALLGAAVAVLVLSALVRFRLGVSLDAVSLVLAGLASATSGSIWTILKDTVSRPTVHTRLVRVGDDEYQARVVDDRGAAVGHGPR